MLGGFLKTISDVRPVEVDPVTKALIDARALVAQGWIQNLEYEKRTTLFFWKEERYCVLGALRQATAWGDRLMFHQAVSAYQEHIPSEYITVPQFNDDSTTEKADVLRVFDKAIEARRASR